MDHPEWGEYDIKKIVLNDCPQEHGCRPGPIVTGCSDFGDDCHKCWNSEIEKPKEESKLIYAHIGTETVTEENDTIEGKFTIATPVIKDSGNRREFESGAVRDMQEGKGRCDLMPLDVVAKIISVHGYNPDPIVIDIALFQETSYTKHLYNALDTFAGRAFTEPNTGSPRCTMCLEVAKHFEEGAKKYGENNWQKGIPPKCYIDSAVRHYLKWLRGDKDEPHDRAFCWNLMCCIWEVDYRSKATTDKEESK
jgi:hypothetical protein